MVERPPWSTTLPVNRLHAGFYHKVLSLEITKHLLHVVEQLNHEFCCRIILGKSRSHTVKNPLSTYQLLLLRVVTELALVQIFYWSIATWPIDFSARGRFYGNVTYDLYSRETYSPKILFPCLSQGCSFRSKLCLLCRDFTVRMQERIFLRILTALWLSNLDLWAPRTGRILTVPICILCQRKGCVII